MSQVRVVKIHQMYLVKAVVPVMVQALVAAKVAAMVLVQERALVRDRAKVKALVPDKGSGGGHGRAHVAFDKQGFYNAVNNQKVIPQQYIRQHKEVHETIYVFVRIDTNGNAVEQYVESGDDPLLREEAMAAVNRALPYQNPTDDIQPVTVPVRFDLSEGTDDDD